MAPTYRGIEERNAGREAIFEAEASKRAEVKAGEMNAASEQRLLDDEENLNTIAEARASGVREGSRAGKLDATRFFAEQGFIPGQMVQSAEFGNQQAEAFEEQDRSGLAMQESSQNGALEAQANDISTKLLEAAMQGAPDDVVNQTLDQLQVPDQVKQAAAQMFLKKRQDVGSQGGNIEPSQQDLRAQFKAQPTESTQRAFGILDETNQRMAELHQKLNPQPEQQQQGGPQNG